MSAAPPAYGDLGKSARDVFRSGYTFDLAKLRVAGPGAAELGFELNSSVNLKSFKAAGSILGKYNAQNYGVFSGKCSSDGSLLGEYSVAVNENVDVQTGYQLSVSDSFQSLKLAGKFHNSLLHASCSLTKDMDRDAVLLGTGVLRLQNFLVGYQAEYDANASRLTKNDLALVCESERTALHLRCLRIPKEFGISAYYKVNEEVDVALDAKLASNDETRLWHCGAGLAYKLDEKTKLRVKIDKNLQLGTSLQFPVQEAVKLTLAFSLDLAQPGSGQHKVGLGLDVEV